MSCNKCKKPKCTCHSAPPYVGGCATPIDSGCVYYHLGLTNSLINKFIGLPGNSTVESIFEQLDNLLDSNLKLQIASCAEPLLNVSGIISVKQALLAVINRLCVQDDSKVKVSDSDQSNGRLTDKLVGSECLKTRIIADGSGNQKLETYIDYECLASKLPQCITVSCCGGVATNFNVATSSYAICGDNKATLLASECDSIIWYNGTIEIGTGTTIEVRAGEYYAKCGDVISNIIIIQNIGICDDCINTLPTLNIVTPISEVCGEAEELVLTAAHVNCNNVNWFRWYPTGIEPLGSGPSLVITPENGVTNIFATCANCAGEVISNVLTLYNTGDCSNSEFETFRAQVFIKNTCAESCTPEPVVYTKRYVSLMSQEQVEIAKIEDYAQYLIEGQLYANNNGDCLNCSCVSNNTYVASINNQTIEFADNCEIDANFTYSYVNFISNSTEAQLVVSTINTYPITSNYVLDYAIVAIDGTTVINPIYQSSNIFNSITVDGVYTVRFRVTKGAVISYIDKSVTVIIDNCITPDASITIGTNHTTICGTTAVQLSVTNKNGCGTVVWIKDNLLNEETLGSGDNITVYPPVGFNFYRAVCFHCAGSVQSSKITIFNSGECLTCIPVSSCSIT